MANVNIKRAKYTLLSLTTCFLLSSCGFNVNNSPGPQMSMSIKEAQKHGTFICEYKIKGGVINGVGIKTIFAEKKFWRQKGLLLKKQINCCESQLVIVSSEPFVADGVGSDINWKVVGFETQSSYIINKDYKSILLPDSIPITVVAIKGKDTSQVIQKLILYKTQNK